jgi:anti-anti-sigma factor
MPSSNVFLTEHQSATLVITPLINVSSLAGDHVQPELDGILTLLQQPNTKNVVVDFTRVTYFGSVMLAATQMIWKRVRAKEGKMALCNVSELGREILHIAKFDLIWPIYESQREALEAVAT